MQSNTTETRNPAAALYEQRQKRLDDTIALRVPDRVPVTYFSHFWQAISNGRTIREVMYDYDLAIDLACKVALDLQPDAVQAPFMNVALGPLLDISNFGHLRWPGHGVGDNCSYQFVDRELMKPEEYDLCLADPSYFCMTRYLPRVVEGMDALASFPQFANQNYLGVLFSTAAFTNPELSRVFARFAEIGNEAQRMLQRSFALEAELATLGFPSMLAAVTLSPFDYFGDCLRGSKGVMLDMYRRKEKLLASMERVAPMLTASAIEAGKFSRSRIIFIPLHWGLDGFMSLEQFKTFYWPTLRKMMMDMIDAGFVPCPLWEGDCTSRLETIADIPTGKAIYWLERTDIFRAKEVLNGIVCLRGNVPPSLLNTGTPDDVKAYCRRLIRIVGKDGGLLVDGAIGIPDEARVENVRAMYEAVREYGS